LQKSSLPPTRYRIFGAPWIRLAVSFRDLVLLMDAPYVGIHFNVAGPPNLLSGCGPAAHAHSREFGAKFSLFVHGENHVSVTDPARKERCGAVETAKRSAYLIGPAYIYPLEPR
jgi:hypothetical protein